MGRVCRALSCVFSPPNLPDPATHLPPLPSPTPPFIDCQPQTQSSRPSSSSSSSPSHSPALLITSSSSPSSASSLCCLFISTQSLARSLRHQRPDKHRLSSIRPSDPARAFVQRPCLDASTIQRTDHFSLLFIDPVRDCTPRPLVASPSPSLVGRPAGSRGTNMETLGCNSRPFRGYCLTRCTDPLQTRTH